MFLLLMFRTAQVVILQHAQQAQELLEISKDLSLTQLILSEHVLLQAQQLFRYQC